MPAERWRREEFLARPGRAVGWGGALLALVLLLALLIPAGPLTIDSRWSELMQDIETPFLTHVALVFNALGHGIWRALTLAGVGLALLLARRWAALAAFAAAEALTPLLSNLIKLAVGRERPPGHMLEAHGTSFPSGHAAYAGATAVALVLLFSRPGRGRRLWFADRSNRDRRDDLEQDVPPGALALGRAHRRSPGRCGRLAQLRGSPTDPRALCGQAYLNHRRPCVWRRSPTDEGSAC